MMKYYIKEVFFKSLPQIFQLIGVLYTCFEILCVFFTQNIECLKEILKAVIILGAIGVIFLNFAKRKFRYTIKNKDVGITLVVGNMFKQRGAKIIPTNTTFDTKMEDDFISQESIQGQYQMKYYRNNLKSLDVLIEEQLKTENVYTILQDRIESKNKRYPIGTTIKLSMEDGKFYFLAIADVNKYGQPKSNFQNLQTSFEKLWNFILEKGHMESIVIPIVGSGRAGINESRQKIIKEIIFSFIAHTGEKKISNELVICIHPKDMAKVNITELKEYLDYLCKFYYENDNGTVNGNAVIEEKTVAVFG